MYLNAENVLSFFPKLFEAKLLDIPRQTRIFRAFMTSSSSYKRSLRSCRNINEVVLEAQLELPMPKFIWVVEVSSPEDYDLRRVDYRWVIDGTANQYERLPNPYSNPCTLCLKP